MGTKTRETGVDQPDNEMVETIIQTGITTEELPEEVENLLAKDLPLTNIDKGDREYIRLLAENIALYAKEKRPPQESNVVGDVGAALLEEPDYANSPFSEKQLNNIESSLITLFTRASRGKGGWQQDKISEEIQTRRVEDAREEEEGRFSRWF
jgi:hypothetical protein